MKLISCLILALLLNLLQQAFSQSLFRNGFELGISIASKPGPVIGYKANILISNHFNISTGIHYQYTGRKKVSGSSGYEFVDKKIFHKISMPISIGFQFNIKKIQPLFLVGYRPSLILSGSVYQKFAVSPNHISTEEYNPFDPDQVTSPAKRVTGQLFAGLALIINEYFLVGLSFYHGKEIEYSRYNSQYGVNDGRLENNDLNLSIVFFLKEQKGSK
jgi:hypothetical protein